METKDKKRLKKIAEMEELLNSLDAVTAEMEEQFEKWLAMQKDYDRLADYYHSDQWMDDHEDSNKGVIPKGMPQGVLSEDAVYNLMIRQRELAREMALASIKILTY